MHTQVLQLLVTMSWCTLSPLHDRVFCIARYTLWGPSKAEEHKMGPATAAAANHFQVVSSSRYSLQAQRALYWVPGGWG